MCHSMRFITSVVDSVDDSSRLGMLITGVRGCDSPGGTLTFVSKHSDSWSHHTYHWQAENINPKRQL